MLEFSREFIAKAWPCVMGQHAQKRYVCLDNLMTTFDNLLEVASLVFIGVLTT